MIMIINCRKVCSSNENTLWSNLTKFMVSNIT